MIEKIINQHSRYRLLGGLVFLLIVVGAVACSEPVETTPIVVTEVVTRQGKTIIVTRVVRQTIQVQVTPVINQPEEPITLDISYSGDYGDLDPQVAVDEITVDIMENVFAGLTRFNLKTDSIEPELATDWEISDGGRTWTFNLRDDIYWIRRNAESPNPLVQSSRQLEAVRPVMAEDVVFSIQRACDPRVNSPDVFILFIIEGCETVDGLEEVDQDDLNRIGARALDSQTLEIRLTESASHFLSLTSNWLMSPVPPDLIEEMGEEWSQPDIIWTSGPFAIGMETVMESRTVLHRNPFWPLPFEGNIDQVNILHLQANDAFALWEDRLLDLSPVPVDGQSTILSRHGAKADLITNQAVFYLAYNFDSPAFNIPEVRQAFSWSIDRERLVEEVHDQQGVPMRHFGPPGVIGAPPVEEVGTGYSPDRARQVMSETIFGDCRLMQPITYLVSASDLPLEQAELLRDMWVEELGCNESQIIIEQVQFGQLLANTRADSGAARPDMWDLGWASYYPDENNWVSDVLHCDDSDNRQRRPCSEVDDLIRQANNLPVDERWQSYREIENLLFGPAAIEPISPLYVRGDYVLRHGWVDYTPAHFGGEQYDTYRVDSEVKKLERTR